MTRFRIMGAALLGFSLAGPAVLAAAPEPPAEAAAVPAATASMTQDQLEAYFQNQKKGAPIQLFLDKGKDVKGTFASYDDYYETVWIMPRAGERGLLSQKGYKLTGIRGVATWDLQSEPAPGTATPSNEDGFILMRKDANAHE